MKQKIPVAVLGATGTVGQRLVTLLADHPWFEVVEVSGSDRSAGRSYRDAVRWALPGEVPAGIAELTVAAPGARPEARFVFSALPSEAATRLEPELAAEGYFVCSNASALRMEPDVPLLIPEINAGHLALIEEQRRRRGWSGFVVTSPNCSTTGVIFPLAALQRSFGVARLHAVTLQAISGAGRGGLAALDIQDNVIPFIAGEERKIETESRKLLGALQDGQVRPAEFVVSAQAHRVPVSDGHMAALSIELGGEVELEAVERALEGFSAPAAVRELPSACRRPLILRREPDRPQAKLDRDAEAGLAITIGRLQRCGVLDYKMVSLVHNSLRGAAAGALLNAEMLVKEGYVTPEQA